MCAAVPAGSSFGFLPLTRLALCIRQEFIGDRHDYSWGQARTIPIELDGDRHDYSLELCLTKLIMSLCLEFESRRNEATVFS